MSSLNLIKLAATENHVQFRSELNEMLYSLLSEAIKEKTVDVVAEVFNTQKITEDTTLEGYIASVITETEEKLGTELSEEEIGIAASHIVAVLEAKKKDEEEEEEDEEEEEEDEEEDEEEEDEEDEDDEEEEEEEDEEEETAKKGGKTFHFDINSHNKGKKK
jgi:hypothetical protein